ncbi:LysR family transcriptional regulator [Mesorhizobium sp. A623]
MTAFSRELRSFIEIAGERSIRGAAEKLNISPSALSRQVQILERDFGVALIVRLPQGIELTAQGKSLLKHAEAWLEDEESLRNSLHQRSNQPSVTIRLGIMECLASSALPLEGPGLPSTNLEVTVGSTAHLTELLLRNELDAIAAFNVPRVSQLRVIFEQDCVLGLVHGMGIDLSGKTSIRIEDCLQWPLCLPDRSLSLHPRLNAELFRSRADAQIVLRSSSIALIRRFVAADKGVSFLTWYDVSNDVRSGLLGFVPLENRRLKERLYICTASNRKMDAGIARVLTALANRFVETADGH